MAEPGDEKAAPKGKRRWWQFSIASMLIVTAVVALCLGLWTDGARRQQRVVQLLEEKGWRIAYSYQVRPPWNNPVPPGPAWIRDWLGIDYVDYVQAAGFEGDSITDADLATLRDLPRLTSVFVDDAPNVTDAGLAHLAVLSDLEDLRLGCPQITDAGLVHLEGLHRLGFLRLESNQITDAGLAHLKGLHRLTSLGLESDQITDAGLVHLQPLKRLDVLALGCSVTDAGMEHLMVLTNLERLSCMGPPSDKPRRAIAEVVFHHMSHILHPELRLCDLCDYLAEYHEIKARLDEDALTATPVDRMIPVNTGLVQDDRLNVVLDSILEPHGLGWYIGEGELVITTAQIATERHAGLNKLRAAAPNLKMLRYSW